MIDVYWVCLILASDIWYKLVERNRGFRLKDGRI